MSTLVPKLRYKVVELGGDYYYELMDYEEFIRKAFYQLDGSPY